MILLGCSMRTLLYGLQSSGASYVTWCRCQDSNTIGIIDLWNRQRAPLAQVFGDSSVVMKATIGKVWSLEDHVTRFQPDKTILVTRELKANLASLRAKPYGKDGGSIKEKVAIYQALDRDSFDEVICFEEFLLGTPLPERNLEEILRFNKEHSAWCRKHFLNGWGFGGLRPLQTNAQ